MILQTSRNRKKNTNQVALTNLALKVMLASSKGQRVGTKSIILTLLIAELRNHLNTYQNSLKKKKRVTSA